MDVTKSELRDSIDALGHRPDRHRAFTSELLAEAKDEMLQSIVEEASRDLSMPIALVNLVLEEIQYFKAYYGLPPELAASRGTARDVSFCQFVVRDGVVFEVTDAKEDPRVPQHLVKNFNIQSYLGAPLEIDDVTVGSLCVIDTKPRKFSEEERATLGELADRVNIRLGEISRDQRATQADMLNDAAVPALAELREMLSVAQDEAKAGQLTTTALASFFRLAVHAGSGNSTQQDYFQRSLKGAQIALENCENEFYDIEANVADAMDIRNALEHGMIQTSTTHLSEVAIAGWELARQHTIEIGGASFPDLPIDPVISTPRPLAVVLVSTCLSSIAARMSALDLDGGINMDVEELNAQVGIRIGANELSNEAFQSVASELGVLTRNHPSVVVQASGDAVQLLFVVGSDTNGR
jgi:hypothetical protein